MIPALVLLPALIALAMLNTSSAARVAIRVYIPCLMLIPLYINFRLGGIFLDPTSLVVVALAVIGWYRWSGTLKLTLLDICVVLNTLSAFYADAHRHELKVAVYAFLLNATKTLFPYLIGRTLIEQTGLRKEFGKAIVLCLALIAILSLWEYRMESNFFQSTVERITHQESGWGRQTRWGFGRIAGPYGHAITAGLIFSTGVMLQLWLAGTKSWNSSKALRFLRSRRKPLYLTLTMLMGLFMTQSRGPWIGCGFGLIVASIGFARNRRRYATIALSGLVVAAAVTSIALNKYTDVDVRKTQDRDQLNAEYRRDLYATYKPLIDQGGLWGWGTPTTFANGMYGWTGKQTSIDNEYLRVAMQQGYVGVTLFVIMEMLTLMHLVRLCGRFRNRDDLVFVYCMLGAVVAMSFGLSTVFLGDPMTQIVYLIFGWSGSIRPTQSGEDAVAVVPASRFAFQRVFA